MRVTWHGHSCFAVETRDGTSLLIDPFLENGRTRKRASDFAPHLVLLTHGHNDHTGSVREFRDAQIVCNWEIGHWLAKAGVRAPTMMNVGASIRPTSALRIWMTYATHSSGLDDARRDDGTLAYGGSACGYVLDDGETRLYVAGDTGLFGDMRTVVRDVLQPDVALLPIGDRYTMGPEHAALAVDWLGVKVAIPCHYGTGPDIDVDPREFERAVAGKADVRILDVDRGVELRGGRVVA